MARRRTCEVQTPYRLRMPAAPRIAMLLVTRTADEVTLSASHFMAHVRQSTPGRCRAARIAMMVNWRDGTNESDHDIVTESGLPDDADDSDWVVLMGTFGLSHVAGASWTPEDWDRLLTPGPFFVGVPGHVLVACGFAGELLR